MPILSINTHEVITIASRLTAAVVYEAAIITTTPVQESPKTLVLKETIGRQAHAPKGPAQ